MRKVRRLCSLLLLATGAWMVAAPIDTTAALVATGPVVAATSFTGAATTPSHEPRNALGIVPDPPDRDVIGASHMAMLLLGLAALGYLRRRY